MSKMGLYRPFGHPKHKLWSKERPGVKLAIWLPTTKSRELTQFPYVQEMCNIPLEISWWGLQLCFRPCCHRRSAQEVMCLQSCRSPRCWNFGSGSLGTKSHLDVAPMERRRVYYKGECGGFLQSGPWWVLCVRIARGSSKHQKCSNYALTSWCWFCAGLCEWVKLVISF
jgi:hypothetical protein